MLLTIIAAVARDGAIGRKGDLAFHIRADLRRFRELTIGHTVVMGRKTFESLPKGALPGRRNIVVTRNPVLSLPGAETACSLEQAVDMARNGIDARGETECFVIGGGELYRQAMPLADKLQLTEVEACCADADTFFPDVDSAQWRREYTGPEATDPSGVSYRFVTYLRN